MELRGNHRLEGPTQVVPVRGSGGGAVGYGGGQRGAGREQQIQAMGPWTGLFTCVRCFTLGSHQVDYNAL